MKAFFLVGICLAKINIEVIQAPNFCDFNYKTDEHTFCGFYGGFKTFNNLIFCSIVDITSDTNIFANIDFTGGTIPIVVNITSDNLAHRRFYPSVFQANI